jgi:hypothetical protein
VNRSGPTRASAETGTDSIWSPTDLRAFLDAIGDRRLLASFVVDAATGLTTINVTADQITVRQAKTDLLAWAPPPSRKRPDSQPGPHSEAQRPAWLSETRLQP